jgi:hypothetical protein
MVNRLAKPAVRVEGMRKMPEVEVPASNVCGVVELDLPRQRSAGALSTQRSGAGLAQRVESIDG